MSSEEYLYSAVAAAIAPIQRREKEWDADKLQKKIISYLSSASKSIQGGNQPLADRVGVFANKFFEAFWRALGDREWLDDIDLTFGIAAAVQTYCDPSVLAGSNEADFMAIVAHASSHAFDSCRYYSWGWQALKKVVTSKVAQKKVRDALDTAREEVVNSTPATSELFISGWIQGTIEHMAKAGGNPKTSLSETDAVRLFDTMVQEGGGLPLPLVVASGGPPPRGWPEVSNAVSLVYANYPDVGGGGGKGYGGGYNPMAAMGGYNPMMGMMGKGGYAPY